MDREKVIKGLSICSGNGGTCKECPYIYLRCDCDTDGCTTRMAGDALALLKEQEVQELSMDEWREWKENSRRDPICMLWENDTSPMWVLNPNNVHEPALLMGKLKLFTGKPTFEQCKAVKWE